MKEAAHTRPSSSPGDWSPTWRFRRGNKNLYAICLDSRTGEELWRKTADDDGRTVPYNKDASPSPIADGERVYFLFGQGQFFACDYEGNELWGRNLEEDFGPLTQYFLYGASPLLFRDRLYLSVIRDVSNQHSHFQSADFLPIESLDSFVLCVDPATGEDIWKQDRPSDAEGIESRDSYATPIPYVRGEKAEIIVTGADYITAHDWMTGEETWRYSYATRNRYRQRICPTPVTADGKIIGSRPRYGPLFAIAPEGTGNISPSARIWGYSGYTPDTPSVLYYRDRIYFIHDHKKIMTCLNPDTGERIWEEKIGGAALYHASPTGADGKVYCINLKGQVVVLKARDKFEILSRIDMGGRPTLSTIAVAQGALFIRTEEKLYCIAELSRQRH